MAKLTTRELEDALKEAVLAVLTGVLAEELNWTDKPNRELAVGDKIVTKFDRKSGRAIAGVTIVDVEHHPRGCKAHAHIKGEAPNVNGCYDHIGRTRVFL